MEWSYLSVNTVAFTDDGLIDKHDGYRFMTALQESSGRR